MTEDGVGTCGESRFDGRIWGRDADWKRGSRGRGRLGPGQGAVSREGDGQSGSLHGGLIVPQLVNPLLLQQQSLLLTHAPEPEWKNKNREDEFSSCHGKLFL